MPTIIPNQDFKHGAEAYQQGEGYEVSDEDAQYFKAYGWVGEKLIGSDASLDIDNIELSHSSEVN